VVDAFAQAKRDAEARGDTEAAELADLDHQIELARRDVGTGLLERGVHHTDLERGFREGRSQQLVFVDMGFLKYFDNKGGADVGDNALLKAADLMEQAVEDAGVTGTVYRYGGDEFTIRIDGDVDAAAKFIRTLEGLRATAGAIPMGRKGDSDGYVPTELVFNYGCADSQLAEDIFADMIAAGMFTEKELGDRDLIANAKADIITIAADKGIEEQKAVGRFEMLIERLRDSTCRTDPKCAMQTEQMIAFSQKALFGDRGGDALLRAWAESGKSLEDLHAEIEEWAVQQQERATSEKGRSRDLMTELIDAHAKIRYYERKLRETEQENEGLARENVELRTKVERLKEEKARAEEDRRRVIETRKGLE
jgi:diguanylate cyclase (GGDEF)-like protein